jgi:hypothetical protein
MFAQLSRRVHRAVSTMVTLGAVGAFTMALSGCAKHPAPNPDAATHPIIIQIDNNITPTYVFAIWVREGTGGGGTRRQIGNAPGAQVTSIPFVPQLFGQQYTLEAVPPLGSTIRRTFSIDNESITMLKWSLNQNVLSYFGQN